MFFKTEINEARKVTGDADCDQILTWLDVHSVSLNQGLPLNSLVQKWRKSGRNEYRLGASLKKLFEQNLVVRVPGSEPVHLRVTVSGYAALIDEPMPTAGATAETSRRAAATAQVLTMTLPQPIPVPTPVAPPPAPAAAPAPEPVQAQPAPAAAASGSWSLDTGMFGRPIPDPGHFIQHGQPLTEMALRNQLLAIYRDLRLGAESRLIAMTLSRYWQENGLRAGDLRLALDVLMRDGYLRQRLDGIDVFWVLTGDGEAYLRAPLANPVLLQLSPAVSSIERRPGDVELQHMALHAWAQTGFATNSELSYPALLEHWQRIGFDDNALLHALDWLCKKGWVQVVPGQPPRFALTLAGSDHARTHLR